LHRPVDLDGVIGHVESGIGTRRYARYYSGSLIPALTPGRTEIV
jgi:hypothetical protein